MTRITYIVICFLLLAAKINAQEQGHVVIHSDHRLAILLKKSRLLAALPSLLPTHTIEAAINPPVMPNSAVKLAHQPVAAVQHREEVRTFYTGKGYRVQIYNGPDRAKAITAKTEFMRRFPGVHTYLIYNAPAFRVKIGDFRNRGDAEGMLREANSMFSPSMIVPDMVTISNN